MDDTIYLDPDLFMALGLSAEAHGGIGAGPFFGKDACPVCVHGHAMWLDGSDGETLWANDPSCGALYAAGLTSVDHDDRIIDAGIPDMKRLNYEQWCRIVGVDVAA